MKIVPAPLLIWLVALIGFPAAIVAGRSPPARPASIAAIAILAIAAAVDAALPEPARSPASAAETPDLVRCFKDRDVEVSIQVHNRSQKLRRIRIGMATPAGVDTTSEEQRVELPAAIETSAFLWTFTPRRRGNHRIDACYLEAASPLGLWSVRRVDPVSLELRAYPNLRRKEDLNALRRGAEGLHSMRQIGRGREFEKLREYVPGDGFDEIHWKATARRGRPITKVYQVERTQEIYVVIDASRLSARPAGAETTLERSITAALLVGAAAGRRGDLFGLAAFSDRVEAFTRARNGKAHYAACRDAIYQIQPRQVSPDFDEIATFLRLRLRRRALLLFLTSLDDPVLAENFERATRLLSRRHLVVVGMPRPDSARPLFSGDVPDTGAIYRNLAGHLAWKRLREIESTLARQGVRLALLDPTKFSGGLIGRGR